MDGLLCPTTSKSTVSFTRFQMIKLNIMTDHIRSELMEEADFYGIQALYAAAEDFRKQAASESRSD